MNSEMTEYFSEAELGGLYEDTVTGFYGTATWVSFGIGGSQRVCLERSVNGTPIAEYFDIERLQPVVEPRGDELSTVVE